MEDCECEDIRRLHVETPCLLSDPLSSRCRRPVYLKLENLQPTGSFKIRGIGHLCSRAANQGYSEIVSSSGGNAGLAAAYAAKVLGLECTVFTPSSTPSAVVDLIRDQHADVKVVGSTWSGANAEAVKHANEQSAFFVHPFDHPCIWSGHSTIVQELHDQLPSRPSLILVSVGGGGLATGLLQGLSAVGWTDVPLVCVETKGAECFHLSIQSGERIVLNEITSVAKTLGASQVCQKLFDSYYSRDISSLVVSDHQAISACINFAADHRMLVEASCGASLAPLYYDLIPLRQSLFDSPPGPVVVIVCGGCAVSCDQLIGWQHTT